jgi:toxin YhaV
VARAAPAKTQLLGAQRRGWHLVMFPAFRDPLLTLAADVARLRQRDPADWSASAKAKLLKRILEVVLDEIPRDPASPVFEQGNTLGADARGWRRAKFLGRFRLFFRFDSRSKVIVYAWVNDENTLRKAGAASDPYAVFRAMLVAGNPPHDWDKLLEACGKAGNAAPIREIERDRLRLTSTSNVNRPLKHRVRA